APSAASIPTMNEGGMISPQPGSATSASVPESPKGGAYTPPVTTSKNAPSSEVLLLKLESLAAVYNGPSQKTVFTLDKPAVITKIFTYHWNNGSGATPGKIALKDVGTGKIMGVWNVTGTYHLF